jgi:hypothetical protein
MTTAVHLLCHRAHIRYHSTSKTMMTICGCRVVCQSTPTRNDFNTRCHVRLRVHMQKTKNTLEIKKAFGEDILQLLPLSGEAGAYSDLSM